MRLITYSADSTSLVLKEFFDQATPPYAILSHTWGKDEVSYQDFVSGRGHGKEGYDKIKKSCELASRAGCRYVWVDTCCIDKTSSAELTEAINAMFSWYAQAQVCYAYLSDYSSEEARTRPLAQALWFFRGWTLQELIAPVEVHFHDQAWRFFGTRTELKHELLAITGIHPTVFKPASPDRRLRAIQAILAELPVAQRMSWAAKRQTTRAEDTAYSLLGIFGVHMPMVYGQGPRAFQLLQEEIIKESNDLTILAWKASPETSGSHAEFTGILATHPSEFGETGSYKPLLPTKFNPSFVMTNKGLQIDANVKKAEPGDKDDGDTDDGGIVMSLECLKPYKLPPMAGILLKHQGGGVYVRCRPETILMAKAFDYQIPRRNIFISKTVSTNTSREVATFHRFGVQFHLQTQRASKFTDTYPPELWEPERQLFIPPQTRGAAGYHILESGEDLSLVLVFGRSANCPSRWWVSLGEKATDRQLYNAAMNKDLATVALLGKQMAEEIEQLPLTAFGYTISQKEVILGHELITRVTITDVTLTKNKIV